MKRKKITVTLLLLAAFTATGAKQELLASIPPQTAASAQDAGITPYAEQTEWRFRTLADGTRQRRLWSITYQKWLTDWITIG